MKSIEIFFKPKPSTLLTASNIASDRPISWTKANPGKHFEQNAIQKRQSYLMRINKTHFKAMIIKQESVNKINYENLLSIFAPN